MGDPAAFGPKCIRLDLLPNYPATLTLQYAFDLVIMGDGTSNAIYRNPRQGDTLTTASGKSLLYVIKCGFGGFGLHPEPEDEGYEPEPEGDKPGYGDKPVYEHEIGVVVAIIDEIPAPTPTPTSVPAEDPTATPEASESAESGAAAEPTATPTPVDESKLLEFRVDGCPAPGSATVVLDGEEIGEVAIPTDDEVWASVVVAGGVLPEELSVQCGGDEVVVPLDGDAAPVVGSSNAGGPPAGAGTNVGSAEQFELVEIDGPPMVAVAAAAAVEGVTGLVLADQPDVVVDLSSALVEGLVVDGLVTTTVGPAGVVVESGAGIAATAIAAAATTDPGARAPMLPLALGLVAAVGAAYVLQRRFTTERP